MAEIIGFFRALFQLRDRRFRRVLIRSVAYSAVLIVGFGLGAPGAEFGGSAEQDGRDLIEQEKQDRISRGWQ